MFPNPIHVYIASTLRLPNEKEGVTGFMIECRMPSGKIETRAPQYCHLTENTPDSSRLKTIKIALNHIRVESEVVVHLDDDRIAGLWTMDMPRRWESTGWLTTRGGEVKNRQLWEGILGEIREKKLRVTMEADQECRYVKMLKMECRANRK